MNRVVIIYANNGAVHGAAPTIIAAGRESTELDFNAINVRGIRMGWGKINAIEFHHDSRLIGTVLFC